MGKNLTPPDVQNTSQLDLVEGYNRIKAENERLLTALQEIREYCKGVDYMISNSIRSIIQEYTDIDVGKILYLRIGTRKKE